MAYTGCVVAKPLIPYAPMTESENSLGTVVTTARMRLKRTCPDPTLMSKVEAFCFGEGTPQRALCLGSIAPAIAEVDDPVLRHELTERFSTSLASSLLTPAKNAALTGMYSNAKYDMFSWLLQSTDTIFKPRTSLIPIGSKRSHCSAKEPGLVAKSMFEKKFIGHFVTGKTPQATAAHLFDFLPNNLKDELDDGSPQIYLGPEHRCSKKHAILQTISDAMAAALHRGNLEVVKALQSELDTISTYYQTSLLSREEHPSVELVTQIHPRTRAPFRVAKSYMPAVNPAILLQASILGGGISRALKVQPEYSELVRCVLRFTTPLHTIRTEHPAGSLEGFSNILFSRLPEAFTPRDSNEAQLMKVVTDELGRMLLEKNPSADHKVQRIMALLEEEAESLNRHRLRCTHEGFRETGTTPQSTWELMKRLLSPGGSVYKILGQHRHYTGSFLALVFGCSADMRPKSARAITAELQRLDAATAAAVAPRSVPASIPSARGDVEPNGVFVPGTWRTCKTEKEKSTTNPLLGEGPILAT